jgi:uncharacterized protein YcbX
MSQSSSPAATELQAVISQLFIYPVKSCAALALDRALLTDQGLEWDRTWMVVDERGEFYSQREFPRLALVQPRLRAADLVLRAPGMLALHLSLNGVQAPAKVRLWDEEIDAWDMGPLAAQWFSDFLGAPARLVRFDPEFERPSSRRWTGGQTALNQFSDGYPLLVIGQPSLDELNQRLRAQGQAAVSMERLRPNIVLAAAPDGAWQAHDEDRVDLLQIQTPNGGVQLRPVKPCARCEMVNVDPQTAARSAQVLDLLQTYRQDARLDGALSFGMNLITVAGLEQTLAVGQPVRATLRFD